jgi:uncharacterized membrane protein
MFLVWVRMVFSDTMSSRAMSGPLRSDLRNTFVMAYALYRSKLVARFIPVLGLIGGPLVFAANVALMFGVPRHDLGVLVVPVFAWEICLTIFLITKGFRSTATTAEAPSEAQYPQLTAA